MATEFYSDAYERKVLHAALTIEDSLEYITSSLELTDFHIQDNRRIFQAVLGFYKRYYKCLPQYVMSKWLEINYPKEVQQIMLLFTSILAEDSSVSQYYKFNVDELKNLSKKRQLYTVYKTIQDGLESDRNPQDIFTSILPNVLGSDSGTSILRAHIDGDSDQRKRLYEDMKAHPEKYKGIPYGMKELDEVTGGMHKSHLYLVFGRTGAGKSQFLFNIGCNAANSGKKVMYVTIEMNYSMLQNMWAAREARIPTLSITNARLTPDQESMYYMFLEWQKEHRISMYLIDIPQGASTGVIEAEIASYTKINGKAPDLVLVDYANLIQPMGKYKDRTEKIDNVFRELKESARAFNTVLYTAAQQNRESLKASKVGTEHISFSDAASHHCDTVLNIHSNEQDEIGNIVHVDIVKGRYHAKKGCELLWEREFNYIGDWDSISYKGQVRDTSSSDGLRFRNSSGN